MATLHAIANGNFTTAATWGLVDSTSFLDSTTTTTTVTTTIASNASNAFIPGAITVQGISLRISSLISTPTGTFRVELYNSTTASVVDFVVINVSDLQTTNVTLGWVYFKFNSPSTLVAGQSYVVRLSTTSISQVSMFASAGTNWSRALVTTTNQVPAAADVLIMSGQHTAAGVNSPTTVTMDNTSNAVSYGNIYIGVRGNLVWDRTKSTALKIAGNLICNYLGKFEMGSEANPIPDPFLATFEISCTTPGQFSFTSVGGTINLGGQPKTNFRAKLNADVTAGATSSTTDISTGWKAGDRIVVPSTTRTWTEWEVITLNADTVDTSMTHSAYVNAHGGNSTNYIQADIGNVSRNVRILSTSGINRFSIVMSTNSTANWYWATIIDTGTVMDNAGINIGSGVTFQMQYCVVTRTVSNPSYPMAVGSTNYNISNCILYGNLQNNANVGGFRMAIHNNNLVIGNTSNFNYPAIQVVSGSNNVIASNGNEGLDVFAVSNTGNLVYSNSRGVFNSLDVHPNVVTSNCRIWRNNAIGYLIRNSGSIASRQTTRVLDNAIIFGNGINVSCAPLAGKYIFNNSYIYGDPVLAITTIGADIAGFTDTIYFNNCTFGKDNLGNLRPHLSCCVRSTGNIYGYFYNCNFFGTENTSPGAKLTPSASLGAISNNHNGVQGAYRMWTTTGEHRNDTTFFNTTSPSLRITPTSVTLKSVTPNVRVAVKIGNTITINVWVRKSITGDGANYNGAQPRLMYLYNPFLGNLTETVGATMTASNGVWQKLVYTTPAALNTGVAEFYVDCNGSTGWINVDDWSIDSIPEETRNGDFWSTSGFYIEPSNKDKNT